MPFKLPLSGEWETGVPSAGQEENRGTQSGVHWDDGPLQSVEDIMH